MPPVSLAALPVPSQDTAKPYKAFPRSRLDGCDLLLSVLECYMTDVIRRNERLERLESIERLRFGRVEPPKSVFHALGPPSITPVEYLRRLARYSFSSRAVFLAAFFYLEKIASIPNNGLLINSLSVHRLVLTAILLATKFIDDVLYDNAHFAKIGGLELKELNMLELRLLKVLDFKLYISCDEFDAFESQILDSALDTNDPDYTMLPDRLRNLGYGDSRQWVEPELRSPTSTMAVSFDSSYETARD